MSRNSVRKHSTSSTAEAPVKPSAATRKARVPARRVPPTATAPEEPPRKADTANKCAIVQDSSPSIIAAGADTMGAKTQSPKSVNGVATKRKGNLPPQANVSTKMLVQSAASAAKPEISSTATLSPILQEKSFQPQPAAAFANTSCPITNLTVELSTSPAAGATRARGNNKPVTLPYSPPDPPSAGQKCASTTESGSSSARRSVAKNLKRDEICFNFIQGRCEKGDRCRRRHMAVRGSECREFKLGDCSRGSLCPLQHVPLPEDCRDFMRGECTRGDQCPRQHASQELTDSDATSVALPISPNKLTEDAGLQRTQSSDSSLSRDDPEQEICRLFMKDRCQLGSRCKRKHPPRHEWHKYLPRRDQLCELFVEGRCFRGENCSFRHPPEGDEDASTRQPASIVSPKNMLKPSNTTPNPIVVKESSGGSLVRPQSSVFVSQTGNQMPAPLNTGLDPRSTPARQRFDTPKSENDPALATSLCVTSQDEPHAGSSRLCFDFIRGRCVRRSCKYRHELSRIIKEPPVSRLDELVHMLENSLNQLRHLSPSLPEQSEIEGRHNRRPQQLASDGTFQQPIPSVPPGLGLQQDPRAIVHQNTQSSDPVSMSITVLDSVTIRVGPGFTVEEVVTGFESKTVVLKNIPAKVNSAAISKALSPFGEVIALQLPDDRTNPDTMTVKATFSSYENAASAADALHQARVFGTTIIARLASHQSTSLGKGTVQDGDVYLEFPAPCKTAFIGFRTLPDALRAIDIADGAQMRELVLSASLYEGIPAIGHHNVRFFGVPADAIARELEVFGPNEGIMLERPLYTNLKDTLKDLQRRLETFGELVSVKVIAPPFLNQTIRAWAHFTSPVAADAACRVLNGRRQRFLNDAIVLASHVMSVQYRLPHNVYNALAENIHRLRSCVSTATHRCDILIFSNRVSATIPAVVKLVAKDISTLTRLKTSFETLLRGQVVYVDLRYGPAEMPAWDHFFSRPAGASFIANLEANNPGVIIQRDTRRSLIRLFGPSYKLRPIRQAIRGKVAELRAQQLHTFPLDGHLVVSLFVNSDLLRLQRELGSENLYIDSQGPALKVRGNKDTVEVVHLLLQQARRRPFATRKRRAGGCPVCLDEVSLPVTLDCGHTWCKHCLSGYLVAAADTKIFPVNCLGDEARCTQPLSLKIARRVLGAEDFHRLAHASFLTYIHSRPSEFHYCPTPDCPQVYRSAPPETILQCPSCLVRICANCHVEYHEGTRCPDRESEDLRLFQEWTNQHDVKRCPSCNIPIEREAGCNHMTCTRCNTHICWMCLETFSKGNDVYDHMHTIHGGIGL